mmetsp:Transcript_10174/g.27131  ORF Transcript_10174/g.27131 Transcript_10174/m.27131 type:complete len:88 (+) Transcript_10174:1843-2106(+)|eukprot:6358198-Prymnesium_polylepis.1
MACRMLSAARRRDRGAAVLPRASTCPQEDGCVNPVARTPNVYVCVCEGAEGCRAGIQVCASLFLCAATHSVLRCAARHFTTAIVELL